jgi:ADP-ribosylglycohydrolase
MARAGGVDSVLGCLLGGAIGDAIGGVAERGRVALSDDTLLTLATCEAISGAGRVDPALVAATFLRWFQEHRLVGLGSATLKALRDLQAGAHWAMSGARGEMAAGNGGAMRIAPLAFLPTLGREAIRDVARITHHNDEAYVGALAVVVALRQQEWPGSQGALLRAVAAELPDSRVRDQIELAIDLGECPSLGEVAARTGCSGWVVETIPVALAAAWQMAMSSFRSALEELVRIGGDTDTIASIAGQVAGARLGLAGLPSDLVSAVPERELVSDVARRFDLAIRSLH